MELVLNIAAGVIGTLGVVLSSAGLRRGWLDLRPENPTQRDASDRLWAPITTGLRKLWAWVVRVVRALFRRPARPTVYVEAGAASGTGIAAGASAVALPGLDATLPLDQQVAELKQQLDRATVLAHKDVEGVRSQLQDGLTTAKDRHEDFVREVAVREETDRRRSIRGLRMELYGFFLVTVGFCLATAGSIVGAASD